MLLTKVSSCWRILSFLYPFFLLSSLATTNHVLVWEVFSPPLDFVFLTYSSVVRTSPAYDYYFFKCQCSSNLVLIFLYLLILFFRYSREDEGLPTCWVKLAYTTVWEWYKWNPCGWNGMHLIVYFRIYPYLTWCHYWLIPFLSLGLPSCVVSQMILYDHVLVYNWPKGWLFYDIHSDELLIFPSRGLVKHCKPSPYWAICTSSGVLLALIW